MSLSFRLEEDASAYHIAGIIRSTGLIDFFAGFVSRSESKGRVTPKGLRPLAYDSETRSHGRVRTAHLEYRDDGSIAVALTPPEDPGRPTPTAQEIAGTVDPLTTILALSRGVAEAGQCAARMPVFDGRRRYDLVLVDRGIDHLAASSAYAVSGDVRRCSVAMVKIAGFTADPGSRLHVDNAEVWLAPPLPGAPALPVKLQFSSDWGPITIRMARAVPAK
jgi:hypothetical protein